MGAHAYAVTNKLTGLAGTAFTYSSGAPSAADRALLCDGQMDERIVTTGHGTSFTIVVNLGSAMALNGWALLNHNLALLSAGAATVRIRAADDSGISSGVVTAKATTTLASYFSVNSREPQNKDHVLQFATVTKQYWELTLAWAGGMINNLAIGEMFAYATPPTLTRKGIYGSGDGAKLFTAETEFSNGGTHATFFGGPVRRKLLRWQDFSSTERDELRVMFYATLGNAVPLLFIDSYEATASAAAAAEQDCIYGRLSGLDDLDYSEMDYSLFQLSDFLVKSLGREVGA